VQWEREHASNEHLVDSIAAVLSGKDEELRQLREKYDSLKSKIAWHRDGVGPDVPVLQERYDSLCEELRQARAQMERIKFEDHIDACDTAAHLDDELQQLRAELAAERERCAGIADAHTHYYTGRDPNIDCDCGAWIAEEIRGAALERARDGGNK